MSAAFRRPGALVAIVTQSRARTPGTGQEMTKALEKKTLTTDVRGTRELHAPWMADHRRSRSDLTSLR